MNFDVLAHEFGHSLIFSILGEPVSPSDSAVDYGGMHESSGDLVAILGSLHFESVLTHLLDTTKGNLFSSNELSRVGELSESRQIRIAFNYLRMSDVNDEPHLRSLPLTGGVFDVMVEVFQKELVSQGLISADLATRSTNAPAGQAVDASIQAEFAEAYVGNEKGFKNALIAARDYLGQLLARTWSNLSPNFLTYHDVVRTLLRMDGEITGGRHGQTIRDCFSWREIQPPAGSRLYSIYRADDCLPALADVNRHDAVLPSGRVGSVGQRKEGTRAGKNKVSRRSRAGIDAE
jgi:hypothetical protein